jgi:dephospho-CoA kinase
MQKEALYMRCIGLTGGIGAGKSLAAGWLRKQNIPVIDADELAREVVLPGSEGLKQIASRFGNDILTPNKDLDRDKLAGYIFNNAQARQDLEAILHPKIFNALKSKLNTLAKEGFEIAVFEAPLLFETGFDTAMDAVILIWADKETRIRRLKKRNSLSRQQALSRADTQMDPERQKEKTPFQVENNASPQSFYKNLALAWSAVVEAVRSSPKNRYK